MRYLNDGIAYNLISLILQKIFIVHQYSYVVFLENHLIAFNLRQALFIGKGFECVQSSSYHILLGMSKIPVFLGFLLPVCFFSFFLRGGVIDMFKFLLCRRSCFKDKQVLYFNIKFTPPLPAVDFLNLDWESEFWPQPEPNYTCNFCFEFYFSNDVLLFICCREATSLYQTESFIRLRNRSFSSDSGIQILSIII